MPFKKEPLRCQHGAAVLRYWDGPASVELGTFLEMFYQLRAIPGGLLAAIIVILGVKVVENTKHSEKKRCNSRASIDYSTQMLRSRDGCLYNKAA